MKKIQTILNEISHQPYVHRIQDKDNIPELRNYFDEKIIYHLEGFLTKKCVLWIMEKNSLDETLQSSSKIV